MTSQYRPAIHRQSKTILPKALRDTDVMAFLGSADVQNSMNISRDGIQGVPRAASPEHKEYGIMAAWLSTRLW